MQSRRNETLGHRAFDFPEFGPPFFAGTMGIETAFRFGSISEAGMASPVFENLRRGNWLIDFFFNRLSQTPVLAAEKDKLAKWIDGIKNLPRYLIPKFFDRFIQSINRASRDIVVSHLSEFFQKGDDFVQSLAMKSISFFTPLKNSHLINPEFQEFFTGLVSR